MLEEINEAIEKSDMVLVGLGEEFDDLTYIKKHTDYINGRKVLEETNRLWLLPAYEELCRDMLPARLENIQDALCRLAAILQDKNYFVVSTSVNRMVAKIPWKNGRLVMPCGSGGKKQCCGGCNETLPDMDESDDNKLLLYLKNSMMNKSAEPLNLGNCPKCGKELILNNIYAEHYNEEGYLPQWQLYTKWLQGTLNRKVLILELGVGMKFPSVIRWPFEKVAFFNNKATFYRVNETLYQMSEELKGKGVSIAKNSIDWLNGM